MPRGSKAAYSPRQKRQARHIEESYEDRGSSPKRAARIAWATVNKQDGGAKGRSSGSSLAGRKATTRRSSRSRS